MLGKLRETMLGFHTYLKNCHMQEGLVIFLYLLWWSKTNQLKLKGSRFQSHMKKDFLTLQLPDEGSNSPSLDVIQGLHSGAVGGRLRHWNIVGPVVMTWKQSSSCHELSVRFVPATVLSVLHMLSHWILTTLGGWFCYLPSYTEEEFRA